MSDDLDPNTNARLKRFAELEVERQSAAIDRILDQHIADYKWLTASLLLLNSGASAAVLNSTLISIYGKQSSGLLYLLGISLALLIGVTSQKFAAKSLAPAMGYRAYWIAVSQGDAFEPTAEREAISKISASAKGAWIVPALGWLSAAAFLAGSVCAGMNLIESPTNPPEAKAGPVAR